MSGLLHAFVSFSDDLLQAGEELPKGGYPEFLAIEDCCHVEKYLVF